MPRRASWAPQAGNRAVLEERSDRMRQRLRRTAPSSHRSGPASKLLTRTLRVRAAIVLPLALLALMLTGPSALGAPSSQQARQVAQVGSLTTEHLTDPLG